MNIYATKFFAACPKNGVRIEYELSIETTDVLSVEEILAAIDLEDQGFHEEIADRMLQRFGGHQTLVANHHSVMIKTTRVQNG